ncbi:MAG: chemotaxis protein CheA [Peptostreptococcaceae bacterium]|jgi:two-component system chemotaxis sensor kinase CheA|nr:chemotaxis protein CheA [Peptostreptococcaceae bacterium]
MFELDQYLDMFLDEAKDNLENLNQKLLDLENDPENKEIVNEIFRIAHTLKGMSSTMGFEKMANLTHKMENILDDVRGDKLNINTRIVDLLFEGLDFLEEFVKNVESDGSEGDVNVEELIENLKNINSEEEMQVQNVEVQEDKKENVVPKTDGIGQIIDNKESLEYINSVVKTAKDNNMKAYKVKVILDEKCMLKSARSYLVFKSIEEHGEIIYSNPSVDDIEDEKFDDSFSLITVNELDIDELKNAVLSVSEIEDVLIEDYIPEEDNQEEIVEQEEVIIEEEKEEKVATEKEEKTAEVKVEKKEAKKENSDTKQKKNRVGRTVRVDIDRLDNLMNLVSELIIVKTRLEDIDVKTKDHNMNEAIEYLERITTSLHDAVTKVRMVPIERVFNRFPRMVRDLSKDLKKEINLIMSGEETEVDRTVIDEIGEPLIHLLRNSIDHGIETPEKRISLGKPEYGEVKLLAYPDGNNVVIEVCDDGSGLNIDIIKKKAVERGVISEEKAKTMDDKDAKELIFAPGFSTANKISNVSGRGVGLDVVKTKIESLGGNVEIETERGKGSKFIIRLPLTLAIIQALLVMTKEEKYAIPLNNIKEITNINKTDIRLVEGKEIVLYRGETLPLISLANVLDVQGEEEDIEELVVVIVKKGEKDLGIVVNSLIGQQEIVIKSLGKYLSGLSFIAGATILGNGSVALIIDTNSLF